MLLRASLDSDCLPFMPSRTYTERTHDLERLLDPTYLPSSSSTRSHTAAYVDAAGEIHDPDYRHFPISPQLQKDSQKRYSRGSPRLHWDMHLDDENALDDDYEEMLNEEQEEGNFFRSTAAHPQFHHRYSTSSRRSSGSRGPHRRPRDASFSTYTNYTPTYYSPTLTTTTLPTSYESDQTVLSNDSVFDEKERRTGLLGKKRRRLSKSERTSMDLPTTQEETMEKPETVVTRHEEEEDDQPVMFNKEREEGEYVPSCGQAMRRQWHALALRFRFGVFRAQRRMQRRVSSLL